MDWETGILSALKPILTRHYICLADAQILQDYARIESSLQHGPYQTYRGILRAVMWQLGLELKFTPTTTELDCLAESLAHWLPFSDTVSALQALKTRYQLAIVSNIDDDLFAATAQQLSVRLDFIITAQQVQSYKP